MVTSNRFGLNPNELALFRRLDTPRKLQDHLNAIPMNFENGGETCFSPRLVVRENRAHCMEGALLAAAIVWFHGQKPLLLDLKTVPEEFDHVVALFKRNGHWGAISKTNHAVLRYREPIYRTVRELAMTYFHEYYLNDGRKSLRSFSRPFDMSASTEWITSEKHQDDIVLRLDDSPHEEILTRAMRASLRRVDPIELKAGEVVEWKRTVSEQP